MKQVKFSDVVKLNKERVADPMGEAIERYVEIEHIEPEDLRIPSWELVAEGTTFTNRGEKFNFWQKLNFLKVGV